MGRFAAVSLGRFAAVSFALSVALGVPNPAPTTLSTASINANGVFPSLSQSAGASDDIRSESGHGALLAWADRLWVLNYLSVPNAGSGTGLYAIDANMQSTKMASHNSTFANRIIHNATKTAIIGPYLIDADGNIRVITDLLNVRIGGMAFHLTNPDSMVYMLGMDGPLWEVDLITAKATQLFDLVKELNIPADQGEQPHFKAAHSIAGKLWVASNTFEQADFLDIQHGGRLAYWSGPGTNWTIVETTAFVEITGRYNMGCTMFAMGWDDASVILKVLDTGCGGDFSYDTDVQTYRLPKSSHCYDHLWTTEWPRIREVETERYLMDMHGMFYELTPFTWGGAAWGVKPIRQHLRMIPDFASWGGFLVLGGNQVSEIFDGNPVTGQSQSGLWFGATDDLWRMGGKPAGWGGPWRYDIVQPNAPSDAYLMTGFDAKVAHLRVEAAGTDPAATNVTITIQIDFTGSAGHRGRYFYLEPWNTLTAVTVSVGGYAYYVFPPGFSAHWVRFVSSNLANATAWLTYT